MWSALILLSASFKIFIFSSSVGHPKFYLPISNHIYRTDTAQSPKNLHNNSAVTFNGNATSYSWAANHPSLCIYLPLHTQITFGFFKHRTTKLICPSIWLYERRQNELLHNQRDRSTPLFRPPHHTNAVLHSAKTKTLGRNAKQSSNQSGHLGFGKVGWQIHFRIWIQTHTTNTHTHAPIHSIELK